MEGLGAGGRKRWSQVREEGKRAPEKSTSGPRKIAFGERRQANYQLPEGLQEVLKKKAARRKVPMATIVEEALVEYLDVVCEECGR